MALNIFGQPPEYLSGLLGIDPEKLRKQAFGTGLVNTALAFAAQPRNQGYGSALPYAARALMAGQQGAQGVYQGALQDYMTKQKIEDIKRQQSQQQRIQEMIGGITDSKEKLYAELAPEEYVKTKMKPPEATKFGLAPRIAINPTTQAPEYVQFNEFGGYKFTGITPTQDDIEIAKLIDAGVLPEGYIGRPPQRQQPANNLPTNNFNLPYDVSFGAPGTTATDIAEGVTGESSIQLGNPAKPQVALPRKAQRDIEQKRQEAEILTPLQQAELEEKQTAKSESQAKKQATLDSIDESIKLIDELIGNKEKGISEHPGFRQAVGKSSIFNVQNMPGTEAYAFMDRLRQIQGKQFLEAFESLKGGGTITEVEGDKATQAMARMNNSTTEDEFIKASRDFQDVLRKGYERTKAGAGRDLSSAETPVKIKGDADYNKLPSGAIFIDPLGNKRRKP
jgi:hypothetical protein